MLLPRAYIDAASGRVPQEFRNALMEFMERHGRKLARAYMSTTKVVAFHPDFVGIGVVITADESGNPRIEGLDFK